MEGESQGWRELQKSAVDVSGEFRREGEERLIFRHLEDSYAPTVIALGYRDYELKLNLRYMIKVAKVNDVPRYITLACRLGVSRKNGTLAKTPLAFDFPYNNNNKVSRTRLYGQVDILSKL